MQISVLFIISGFLSQAFCHTSGFELSEVGQLADRMKSRKVCGLSYDKVPEGVHTFEKWSDY